MLMLFVVVNLLYSSLALWLVESIIEIYTWGPGVGVSSTCDVPISVTGVQRLDIVCSCTAYESIYCGKLVDFTGPANCTVKRTAGQLEHNGTMPGMHMWTAALIMTMLFSLVICCKPVDDDEIANELELSTL
jgi:hypothetical protein